MAITKATYERLQKTPTKTQRARRDKQDLEEILRTETELWESTAYRPVLD